MAASVIPYDVNSPLWSDGADKQRGMALPDGAKIHVKNCATTPAACPQGPADDGKWVIPVGTVMVKSFLFDGKLVETRLFVRFDADHLGRLQLPVGRGADRRDNRRRRTRRGRLRHRHADGDWHYPSRMDCMTCHAPTGGSTLGPETAQMNRVVGGMNQIDRFAALGVFDAAPATPYKAALPDPRNAQGATEQRARSYLHANCGFCHRPDDPNFADHRPAPRRRVQGHEDLQRHAGQGRPGRARAR